MDRRIRSSNSYKGEYALKGTQTEDIVVFWSMLENNRMEQIARPDTTNSK